MDEQDKKYSAALSRGIKILGRRAMSESALRSRLSEEGYPDCEIDGAADELRRMGFLNDLKYAEALVHYYTQRGFGQKRIMHELTKRGIDKDLAEDLCSDIEIDSDEIYELLCSRIKSCEPDSREINRAVQFMLRRGFSYDLIMPALDRLKNSLEQYGSREE